jgi:hypothetical protein
MIFQILNGKRLNGNPNIPQWKNILVKTLLPITMPKKIKGIVKDSCEFSARHQKAEIY